MAEDKNCVSVGMRTIKRLRYFIPSGCLALILAHLIWPKLAIDSVTLTLIVIAILPWLTPLVRSLELPGGLKIELQELQEKLTRAESSGLIPTSMDGEEGTFSLADIAKTDPNLALAGLRIEIEKRLAAIAEKVGIPSSNVRGVGQLLRLLSDRGALTEEERSILSDMVCLLNKAVHGAEVDTGNAIWAIESGERLLSSLDAKIK